MGDAPTPPAQTPMAIVEAGMMVMWSAECAAALANCGINPDNFGTYDARAKAQGDMRADYRKKRMEEAKPPTNRPHESNCGAPGKTCSCHESPNVQNEMGIKNWMVANSQSGHIAQNAFNQSAGARGDECANMPPAKEPPSPPSHAGTYGYQDNKALCMDHHGKSTTKGDPHYEITQQESANAKAMKAEKGVGGPVSQDDMKQGVQATANIAVNGSHARHDDPKNDMTKQQLANADKFKAAQDKHAAELTGGKAGDAGSGQGGSGGAKPGSASGPGNGAPTPADKQKAIDCITAAWEASVDTMRKDVVNEHSAGAKTKQAAEDKAVAAHNKKNPDKPIKDASQLPPETKAKIDAEAKAANDAKMKELEKKGAASAGKAGDPSPTSEECREYQACWLYNQQQGTGGFPPMQGNVPGGGKSTPGTGKSGGNKKK